MRKPPTFRQADLTRAAKGFAAAGVEVARWEIDASTGKIIAITATGDRIEPATPFDKWKAKANQHARSA
jgi:hypothetical protein